MVENSLITRSLKLFNVAMSVLFLSLASKKDSIPALSILYRI